VGDRVRRRALARIGRLVWRSDRRSVRLVLVLIPINSVSAAALAWAVKLVVDAVAQGDATAGYRAVAMAALASAVMSVCFLWQHNLERLVSDKVSMHLDRQVLEVVTAAPGIEHFERPEYLDRVDLVVDHGRDLAASVWAATDIIATGARLVVSAWLLASVSPWLLPLPVFTFPVVWVAARSRAIVHRTELEVAEDVRRRDALHDLFIEPATAKEISVFGVRAALSERSASLGRSVDRRRFRSGIRAAAMASGGWVVYSLALGVALWLTVGWVNAGSATVGDILLVWGVGESVRFYLTSIAQRLQELLTSLEVYDRFMWLDDWSDRHCRNWSPVESGPVPRTLTHGIDLADMSFGYPGTETSVLRSIDVHLAAGSVVALVGDNGAGKSTLVKVVMGMYRPTQGAVLADHVPVDSFAPDAWHAATSATYQDHAHIEAVLRTTVGLGDLLRMNDDVGIVSAIQRAAADDMLALWPSGLDTRLGRRYHRGVEPSGGQWQRLAIARSLFRSQPLLLVLDEPTSAIDPLHEAELLRRYAVASNEMRARGGVTLLISHRFSAVTLADHIVVLAEGMVAEQGSHTELLAAGGRYAAMFDAQRAAYEA
jgi:ATP-binding cassette subfamily B protein